MRNSKLFKGTVMFLALIMSVLGVASLVERVRGYSTTVYADNVVEETVSSTTENTTTAAVSTTLSNSTTQATSTTTAQPTTSSGKNYPVLETQFGQDGITYKNFSVKNYTDFDLNIKTELNKNLGFKLENNHQVQVLIVHTHACESYLKEDTGYYSSDYYPRTTDDNYNVTAVGDKIEQELKNAGIGVVHNKTHHDYPSFNGSYERSYDTISKYMKKYKNIKVVLDIHRDAIGEGGESGKTKPVFKYKGKKAAQIMIMTGYEYEGGGDFLFWEENLRFALKLQQTTETMYPGITRPLNFGEYTYNLNVCNGSLLIEVGTDVNTLTEVKRTGTMLGKALAKVLQNS